MAPQIKGIAYKAQRPINKAEKLKKQQQKLMVFNQQGNSTSNKREKNGKGKNTNASTKIFEDLKDEMELNNDEDEQEYSNDEDEESMKEEILDEDDPLELDEDEDDDAPPEEFSSLKNIQQDEFPTAKKPTEKRKLKLSKKKRDLMKGDGKVRQKTLGNGYYKIAFTDDIDDNDEGSLMCSSTFQNQNQKSFKEELLKIAAGKKSSRKGGKGRSWR